MAKEGLTRRVRAALAEVEEQRDDAVVYLSVIKVLLDVLARCDDTRRVGQDIAEALVAQLALETCAVAVLRDRGAGDDGAQDARELGLAGFATQAQRLGGPRGGLGEAGWLALARLVRAGTTASCFRRLGDGSFESVAPGNLAGEGFLVLPFAIGGEPGGALVLHSLVTPAQTFARPRALALVAEIVGQVLTIARMRASVGGLCRELESELGITRRALSDQQRSLRAHEQDIQALTQALIRSNRVKREFLGAVSHELRTPLNAILGYTGLLRDGMVGAVTGEQTALLDRVLSSTRHLNALIDDILFFVQIETDRVLVRRQRIAAGALVEAVVGEVPDVPGRTRVPLRVEIAPQAAVLSVDEAVVRRLLCHLLSNAFKFTHDGAVMVAIRPGDEVGSVVIVVRDTGIGIPPERVDEMFELFQQADASTTRQHNGLGMGLTLVQRCVRLLAGDVSVESEPGRGSEFRVRIPDALAGQQSRDDRSDEPRLMH